MTDKGGGEVMDKEFLSDFYQKLAESQEPLGPEFQKVIDDNFWDLLVMEEDPKPKSSRPPTGGYAQMNLSTI